MTDPDSNPSDEVTQLRFQFTDEIDSEESIIESDDGLVKWIRDEFGNGLRAIGAYDEHTYELLYLKAEVRKQYTRQEQTAVGDEYVLSGRQEDSYHERLYHLGSFSYEVQGFEQGQVIRIPLDMRKGLILSFDNTVNISIPQFVDQLKNQHDIVFR